MKQPYLSAGHGTLASALTSLCLILGSNPQIAERCRIEQSVFDLRLSREKINRYRWRWLTQQQRQTLNKYLRGCLKSIRLC